VTRALWQMVRAPQRHARGCTSPRLPASRAWDTAWTGRQTARTLSLAVGLPRLTIGGTLRRREAPLARAAAAPVQLRAWGVAIRRMATAKRPICRQTGAGISILGVGTIDATGTADESDDIPGRRLSEGTFGGESRRSCALRHDTLGGALREPGAARQGRARSTARDRPRRRPTPLARAHAAAATERPDHRQPAATDAPTRRAKRPPPAPAAATRLRTGSEG